MIQSGYIVECSKECGRSWRADIKKGEEKERRDGDYRRGLCYGREERVVEVEEEGKGREGKGEERRGRARKREREEGRGIKYFKNPRIMSSSKIIKWFPILPKFLEI